METKQNLFQKIQAVSNEIRNLEKKMTVGDGKYNYKAVGDLDVTLAVKDAETKYKIVSIPFKQELINSEVIKTVTDYGKDSLKFVDTIKMTVRIIDLDDTEKFIDIESFGKGIDSGDKGFGKAATYARKYALLNAYKIATGTDPDEDKSQEIKTITVDEKLNAVKSICEKDNEKLQNILTHFNIGELDLLTKEQTEIIYNQFKSKRLL